MRVTLSPRHTTCSECRLMRQLGDFQRPWCAVMGEVLGSWHHYHWNLRQRIETAKRIKTTDTHLSMASTLGVPSGMFVPCIFRSCQQTEILLGRRNAEQCFGKEFQYSLKSSKVKVPAIPKRQEHHFPKPIIRSFWAECLWVQLLSPEASWSIMKHHDTSPSIITHHQTSSNIIKHQQTWSNIINHNQTSSNIIKHQAPSYISKHRQSSANISKHQTSSNISKHRASANIKHHQTSSCILLITRQTQREYPG